MSVVQVFVELESILQSNSGVATENGIKDSTKCQSLLTTRGRSIMNDGFLAGYFWHDNIYFLAVIFAGYLT